MCSSDLVLGLTTQTEYGLRHSVARLRDGTHSRQTLGDEDHCLLGQRVLAIGEVYLAVTQLTVVHRHLLSCLASLLLYARDRPSAIP